MRGFSRLTLPPVAFTFGSGVSHDKFGGLTRFGPYKSLGPEFTPRFAFVFPTGFNDHANRLYLALKNGLGTFRGVERVFRLRLEKEQVFPITGFRLPDSRDTAAVARAYTDAIGRWLASTTDRPHLVFVLHPRTPRWETESPYYHTKALLLSHGLFSQDVTLELIDDSPQFEWSAANIALSSFTKLGGVPWILEGQSLEGSVAIGVGRSGTQDPDTRQGSTTVAFTACFSSAGTFQFFSMSPPAQTKQEYLRGLKTAIHDALQRAASGAGRNMTSVTVHVPWEMSRDETTCIRTAVSEAELGSSAATHVLRVGDEPSLFAVWMQHPDGTPPRGTVVRTSDHGHIVYTEGREETRAWRGRAPTAIRVLRQTRETSDLQMLELIRQVNNLSQVNWRGFNSRARPVTIHYSSDIARILARMPSAKVEAARRDLSGMWFL